MKDITLNIGDKDYVVRLPEDESFGALKNALDILYAQKFEVKSPNNGTYQLTGEDIENLISAGLLYAMNELRQLVSVGYQPERGCVIRIYIPTDDEFSKKFGEKFEHNPIRSVVANEFGELISVREYQHLHKILEKKGLSLWKIKTEEAYKLLTTEEKQSLHEREDIQPVDHCIQKYLRNKTAIITSHTRQ